MLGRGGFAPVWLAREVYGATELRTAAVKLFSLDAPDNGGRPSSTVYRAQVIEEARALCQVEHPSIVRFYALQTDDARGVMGLAMEYAAGTSLDKKLAERATLSVAETLLMGTMIASALSAVHRAGLVHRDVKPANVVESGGVFKLIDFGIAAADAIAAEDASPPRDEEPGVVLYDDLPLEVAGESLSLLMGAVALSQQVRPTSSRSGRGRAGTLGYMDPICFATAAPEAAASDLYALGATLFECLTGKLPAAASGAQGLDFDVLHGRKPPPPLLGIAPDIPPGLARLVDSMLAPARRDRPRSASFIALELDRLRSSLAGLERAPPAESIGPFRGLGRFEGSDRDVYFGRTSEVATAIDMLRGRPVVALIGPSGSGKSSLARAGVLPLVAEGALGGWPKRWDTAIATPGEGARGALAAALALLDPPVQDAADLTPGALVEALAERAQTTERGLLLLVDQLEELVTLGAGESRAWTTDLLARLGEQTLPGLRVLVTVRRDLLDPLLGLGGLGKALVRGSLLVAPMSDAAWGEVIDQALAVYGYTFQDDQLRSDLLAQLEGTASAMPLVQFALTELWHKRDPATKQLTRASFEAIGGIAGALERHADETLARLTRTQPGGEKAARNVLLSLTTPQGTRALRAPADVAAASGPMSGEVIEMLESARLIVREAEGVTLAHEALLVQWNRLRTWVAEARQDRLLAEEIERDAALWRADDTVAVWKKRRLDTAMDVLARGTVVVSAAGRAFVQAGRMAERRARVLIAGSIAMVLLSMAGGGVAYVVGVRSQERATEQALRTEQNALRKEQDSREIAEASRAVAEARTRDVELKQAEIDALMRKLSEEQDKESKRDLADQIRTKIRGARLEARPPAKPGVTSLPAVPLAPPSGSSSGPKIQPVFE
jgi:serine/threonine protein kinase